MKTGEEFYRWTVTSDMPSDVFELLAEIERLNDVIKQLTETTESFLEDKHFYMEELRKANAEIKCLREENDNLRKWNDEYFRRYIWLSEFFGHNLAANVITKKKKELEEMLGDNEV